MESVCRDISRFDNCGWESVGVGTHLGGKLAVQVLDLVVSLVEGLQLVMHLCAIIYQFNTKVSATRPQLPG